MRNKGPSQAAFTLVELLVVIAIIALLLAVLLPAIGAVQNKARLADTKSLMAGLDTAIESYRGEQSLGAGLPPSAGDNTISPQERIKIATPPPLESIAAIDVSGAHLLVLALMGDGLGTAGFKNVPGSTSPGWWDDTHKVFASNGLYSIDPATGKERHVRYGPYIDEKLKARVRGLDELAAKGTIVGPGDVSVIDFIRAKLPVFLDTWDHPILYYKSSPASTKLLADSTGPGIYRHADNAIITGGVDGDINAPGLDFGAGRNEDYKGYHAIAKARGPLANATVTSILEDTTEFPNSFALFILDQKVKSRPTPVQKDSYLLISAGPDGVYGTGDDVTNWTRETD